MQSEIGLMLPTTAPGLYSKEEETPFKEAGHFFPQGQPNCFALKKMKYVSLPKLVSLLVCCALRRFGSAACMADKFVTVLRIN